MCILVFRGEWRDRDEGILLVWAMFRFSSPGFSLKCEIKYNQASNPESLGILKLFRHLLNFYQTLLSSFIINFIMKLPSMTFDRQSVSLRSNRWLQSRSHRQHMPQLLLRWGRLIRFVFIRPGSAHIPQHKSASYEHFQSFICSTVIVFSINN